ncbi:MAG: Gfo/Idh/MocA family protein [Phycisphaerales bacterium]
MATRREFMKSSVAAAAAVSLPDLIARGAHARGSDALRIGVIGCGGRGTGATVQALRADKGAVLVAMGDVFADRLESCLANVTSEMGDEAEQRVRVPEDRRFVGFDSHLGVINSEAEVVLITGYPAFRPAHLAAAVAAGKHVFAEKPLAVDAPGVRSVLESAAAAKARNTALLVGFCWRYNDGMRGTFERVHGGAIGRVQTVHTTYHTGTLGKRPRKPEWTDLEFQMRNWWHFAWISGDHVVEQAVHSIDRLAWAMGDEPPARVTCLGGRAARSGPEHGDVYDHFAGVYEYADGRRAFHTTRQIDQCPHDNTDYIYGTAGSCTVNGWAPTYSCRDLNGAATWNYTGRADRDMYQTEHDELFASIRSGAPINDGERGARSTLTAIMARMAAYTGATVEWTQAMGSTESLVPDILEFGPRPMPRVPVPGVTKFG